MPKTAKTKKQIASKAEVQVTLSFPGEVVSVEGATVLDCFNALVPKTVVKGKAILSVVKGDRKREEPLRPMFIKRFLMNSLYRQILAKRFTLFLG